jgi:sulfatase modifying factor 1
MRRNGMTAWSSSRGWRSSDGFAIAPPAGAGPTAKAGAASGTEWIILSAISYRDVQAYCGWAGVRLPTPEEWEVACRAGTKTHYFFGKEDSRIGDYANIWHGRDHLTADHGDRYLSTSPVGKFKPNPWGLYDMYGNVFEFCTGKVLPRESPTLAHARGGSWWCSRNSCHSFNSNDIGQVNIHASFNNLGFRMVQLVKR